LQHNVSEKSNIPYLVMASVSDKNVSEMIKFAIQLIQVVVDEPVLRAHSGYISELIVHGIGPIPASTSSNNNLQLTKLCYF